MKKLIWLTTTFVVVLVFVVPAILSLLLKMIPTNVQPGFDTNIRLAIYRDRSFTQKFISGVDNLTAIGMSIRNPNLKNRADVNFNLYDSNLNLLRTVTVSGQNIEDGSFTKFIFQPIITSQSKEYIFTVSSPNAGPEETIELFIIGADKSSGITEYSYLGKNYPGGTPIVLYGKPVSKLSVVVEVYSSWISRFLLHRSQTSL